MQTVGEGTRTLNFLIDTIIVCLLAYIVYRTWTWYVFYWRYTPLQYGWFFFGMQFVYYFVFESIFSRTPGKWFTGTKVVTTPGKRANPLIIFWRSVLRLVFIGLFLSPFVGTPLHDFASGTRVVSIR